MFSFFRKGFRSSAEKRSRKVVLSLATGSVERFEGFSYSVAEGKRLAKRSWTELPEFRKESASSVTEVAC
jgi:hypothetical protein